MRRARLNLLIDAVIGIAFLVTAATGVVFLLPAAWQQAVLVGLSFHAWHWLHDWSGAVAAAGVTLHLALHWRWVVHTSRRWLAEAHGGLPERRPAEVRSGLPDSRQVRQPAGRSSGRLTRRGFMIGAAGFGAALIGGVALSKFVAAADTNAKAAGSDTSNGTSGSGSSSSSGSGSVGASSGATGASNSAGSSSSGSATTTTARVVVDSSSCIACGRCLQVCPKSVFAWNGDGRATAESPDSCILCRRCVEVCPASAITLIA